VRTHQRPYAAAPEKHKPESILMAIGCRKPIRRSPGNTCAIGRRGLGVPANLYASPVARELSSWVDSWSKLASSASMTERLPSLWKREACDDLYRLKKR
jgi:hypothetical protein